MKRMLQSMLMLVAILALVACGGETAEPTAAPAAETNNEAPAAAGGTTSLTVNSAEGATLAYQETSLTAPAGTIELTFNNVGAIPHNVTIVPEGQADAVNQSAQTNAPGYEAVDALAQTPMLDAGASDTISFELQPGTYTYLCTFPGHYAAGMTGTLVVE